MASVSSGPSTIAEPDTPRWTFFNEVKLASCGHPHYQVSLVLVQQSDTVAEVSKRSAAPQTDASGINADPAKGLLKSLLHIRTRIAHSSGWSETADCEKGTEAERLESAVFFVYNAIAEKRGYMFIPRSEEEYLSVFQSGKLTLYPFDPPPGHDCAQTQSTLSLIWSLAKQVVEQREPDGTLEEEAKKRDARRKYVDPVKVQRSNDQWNQTLAEWRVTTRAAWENGELSWLGEFPSQWDRTSGPL